MIYLDNAATTLKKPMSVSRELFYASVYHSANAGRGGHKAAMDAATKIYSVREKLAKFFNISEPWQIAFTKNTTEAINYALKGYLEPGDHVIISSMEHNAVYRPINALKSKGITHSIAQADAEGFLDSQTIAPLIKRNTKLICVIHASNVCGTINDIEDIGKLCKNHNIPFMVDAAQSAGVLNIDVEKCNIMMLAFPGHKCLYGPLGTGGLYVHPSLELNTVIEGGSGSHSELAVMPYIMPDSLEVGTQNSVAISAFGKGIDFVKEKSPNWFLRHERGLANRLIEKISRIPNVTVLGSSDKAKRVGIVALDIQSRDCVEVMNLLDKNYNIATRAGLHCAYLAHKTLGTGERGALRISFGAFNTIDDVEIAATALSRILTAR